MDKRLQQRQNKDGGPSGEAQLKISISDMDLCHWSLPSKLLIIKEGLKNIWHDQTFASYYHFVSLSLALAVLFTHKCIQLACTKIVTRNFQMEN